MSYKKLYILKQINLGWIWDVKGPVTLPITRGVWVRVEQTWKEEIKTPAWIEKNVVTNLLTISKNMKSVE